MKLINLQISPKYKILTLFHFQNQKSHFKVNSNLRDFFCHLHMPRNVALSTFLPVILLVCQLMALLQKLIRNKTINGLLSEQCFPKKRMKHNVIYLINYFSICCGIAFFGTSAWFFPSGFICYFNL